MISALRLKLAYVLTLTAIAVGFSAARCSLAERLPLRVFSRLHSGRRPANAKSCEECHSIPIIGGSSRRTVMRAGTLVTGKYVGVPDGGILHTINYNTGTTSATIHGARVTLNLLGDGYIEAVRGEQLERAAREQTETSRGRIHGEVVYLALGRVSGGTKAVGRFGWKSQHASIDFASADALLHELGVPNRIFPAGSSAPQYRDTQSPKQADPAPDELGQMVAFIRGTEPIAPDPSRSASEGARSGSQIFDRIGCSLCHLRTLKTAPPGSRILGTDIIVSERLGNKEIHPFSDYLLHDVGTGDGIIQNVEPQDYAQSTANKFRTAPLWGLRYRLWMMHDGRSITYHQAIMRHRGEALSVTLKYAQLSPARQYELEEFLASL